jgi:hypothetical protein
MFKESEIKSDETKSKQVGCGNTPERNSYYCKDHNLVDELYLFNCGKTKIRYSLSQIKESKIDRRSVKIKVIHDSFQLNDDHGTQLYLVELLNDKNEIVWVNKTKVTEAQLKDFQTMLENVSKDDVYDEVSCNTNKEIGVPFDSKSRTKGVLISSFNCGIINGFKELFIKESSRQVILFYLEMIEKTDNIF